MSAHQLTLLKARPNLERGPWCCPRRSAMPLPGPKWKNEFACEAVGEYQLVVKLAAMHRCGVFVQACSSARQACRSLRTHMSLKSN